MKYILFLLLFISINATSQVHDYNIKIDSPKNPDSVYVLLTGNTGAFAGRGRFTSIPILAGLLQPFGAVSNGDKGDIDVTGTGATWNIDTNAVGSVEISANAVGDSELSPTTLSGFGITDAAAIGLSNLSGVAINTDLLPATTSTINLGGNAKLWAAIFLANGGLNIRSLNGSKNLIINSNEALSTANRTLNIITGDADRTLDFVGGNLSINGTSTIDGTFSGSSSGNNTGDQNLSSYALDANVVHKTTDETVAGEKTLSDTLKLNKGILIDTLLSGASTDSVMVWTKATGRVKMRNPSSFGVTDHGLLTGLADDDHSQYALLAGRAAGQTLNGGNAANDDLTINGTSHATKTTSYVNLQTGGGNVGIGTATPDKALEINSATGANLRLTYNDSDGSATNKTDFSTSSGGDLTIAPSGADVNITGKLTASTDLAAQRALLTSYAWIQRADYGPGFYMTNTLVDPSWGVNVGDAVGNTDLVFATLTNGLSSVSTPMRITRAGNTTIAGTLASTATSVTIAAAATTFAVASNVVTVTGDAGANTVATIAGGASGQILTLIFADALVTITDTGTGAANTINLSAAFTSTANDVVTLVHNGTSWREISRSIN